MIWTPYKDIGEARFVYQVFALTDSGRIAGDNIAIFINFLETFKYNKYAETFHQAYSRVKAENLQKESEDIYSQLIEKREPQLLIFNIKEHEMGLNLESSGDFVFCELFNTGIGRRKYHFFSKGKCQPMLQVKVPATSFNSQVILSFLSEFKTVDFAYNAVLNLEGAEIQKQSKEKAILMSVSQGNNCSFKWLTVFLRHKMPTLWSYRELMYVLFTETLRKAQINPDPELQKMLKMNEEFIREKIDKKRALFLQALDLQCLV